jgi:1-acyl-sn-glycerol-3-phosphate acyltransferase
MPRSRDASPRRLPGRRLAQSLIGRLMASSLRRTFRRVAWIGPWPELPPDRPVVLYANHHSFYDGYLGWLLLNRHLNRKLIVWMEAWDQTPIFGPIGALPFPPDDARRRASTMRETTRRFREDPATVLLYFPEARLRSPDRGLGDFPPEILPRLARLLPPETLWWPVGIHMTWWNEDRPTALLAAGEPHDAPTGDEREQLLAVLDRLRQSEPEDARPLLEGPRSMAERFDLAFLAPLFSRWT